MIKALILYYLSIKPTHGYEIQKFIQLSGTDQWVKIQSGSIYYALTKLEKEKSITVLREERTGSRVRKIYEITKQGLEEMHKEMEAVLRTPIQATGSPKFIIEPMLSILSEEELQVIIRGHIKDLQEKKAYWEHWRAIKAGDTATKLVQLSFSMTIQSLENQILWHEELLENLPKYRKDSDTMKQFILHFDADNENIQNADSEINEKIKYLTQIKSMLKVDPNKAIDNLDSILEELMKQRSN